MLTKNNYYTLVTLSVIIIAFEIVNVIHQHMNFDVVISSLVDDDGDGGVGGGDPCAIGGGSHGDYNALQSKLIANGYISTYQSAHPSGIKAMNISNNLIQALIDEHERHSGAHDGYRVFYGDITAGTASERVAVLKPLKMDGGTLKERIGILSKFRVVTLEAGAEYPCPMLCDTY